MTATTRPLQTTYDLASTRTLRLAAGIALALTYSQAVNWPASFITPVLVSLILCLPLPAPTAKFTVSFLLVISGSFLLGLLLLPMLHYQPAAGVLLISLCVFGCFYYGASGGSSAVTTFLLVGATIVPAIGSESVTIAVAFTQGLIVGAIIAFAFIWIAFKLFPDPIVQTPAAAPKPVPPAQSIVIRNALRSSAVLLPAFYWLLVSSETASYAVILVKIATMGQQSSFEDAQAAGRDLIASTLIGGAAAILVWNILQIWPTLVIYGLLFLLCGLVLGPKVFSGDGLAKNGPVWSYGLLTMMVIVAPAAIDSASGDGASTRFADRITMFFLATLYAISALYMFDALWPSRTKKIKN
jgi:hypothetical protein